MSYFKAHNGDRKIIGIGLSKELITKLQEGSPYWIRGEEVGFEGDILVLAGNTDDDIAKRLRGNMAAGGLWLPPGLKDH